MTTNEAAQAWGLPVERVTSYCQRGIVAGAKKIMRPGWSHPRWDIPRDAKMPALRRGRPSDSLEEVVETSGDVALADSVLFVEMPDPAGISPERYVWENQEYSIKRIADALKITSTEVTVLYDKALKMYLS